MWFAEKCCRAVSRGAEAFGEWRGYGYPVKEAPGYFEFSSWRAYWLDNERLLYGGHSDQEYEQRSRTVPTFRHYSLRIWNVNFNTVEHLDEAQGGICYFGGYLRYETKRSSDEVVAKEGTLGNLVEVHHPMSYFSAAAQRERDEHRHFFNCRTYRYADLGPEAICLTPLLENDGILDATGGRCKPRTLEQLRVIRETDQPGTTRGVAEEQFLRKLKENPVIYYRTIGSEPVALPIKSTEGGPSRYSDWSHQYVVIGYQRPKGLPRPIYLISRGGKVAQVDLPWEDWHWGDVNEALPTKRGLLVKLHRSRSYDDVGHAGLYLIQDGALRQVLRAFVTTLSVAPDGCKVAIGIEEKTPRHFAKLKMIDVCRGDKS